jgi:MFS superfamily sulfate permease-like transporter
MSSKTNTLLSNLKYDFPAGLVVSLVALPLCLGVALASTGRADLLFSGIIAGVIGGIVVGSLSGSALGVSGPAAGLVVIVLTALDTLGSFEAFLLAVVLAGVLQVVAGFLKAGVVGYYFPSSVIKGMLAAIGITLILKEIPHALGYDAESMGDEVLRQPGEAGVLTDMLHAVQYSSTGAILIAFVSIALLVLFEQPFMKRVQLFRFLPGALFVVLLGIGLNIAFAQFYPAWTLAGKHLVQLPVVNKEGIRVAAPGYDPQRVANYKQPQSGVSPAVGVAVPHTPSASLADRNYKIQRVNASRPTSQPDTQLVSKPRRQLVPEGD